MYLRVFAIIIDLYALIALLAGGLQGEVDTHRNLCTLVHRCEFLADLAQCAVHGQIEVEAYRVHVQHPAETGAKGAQGTIDVHLEPVGWSIVDAKTLLIPAEVFLYAGAGKQTHTHLLVER